MPLTVRQDSRRNTATALSAMFFTSHAQVSSSTYVHFAPGRAHGTCATSTPCSGHRTRGAAACRNVRVVPVSTVRHRLVPAPESYPGHGRRHCPHRPADLASGRTDTTRTSSSPSGSTWTVTSSMTMPWTPNSCPNTLALRMPCPSPSFRSLSKTKTTAGRGMSLQNRRSATHYNVTRAFRPRRGCHTALRDVERTWTGTKWFIEGDISDCFGSLDHEIMVRILSEKIHDNRFLRLIKQMLKAGYLEDWKYHETLSGSPQGGVVSPILSNIYLHKLDVYVETVLIPQYTRGKYRQHNPEYERIKSRMWRTRARGDRDQARILRRTLRQLPSGDPQDPGYRRLRYTRYADDHLLGFTGPKAEAE